MDTFLTRFKDNIKGVLQGFDRIVFKGVIRSLMSAVGAMSFFRSRGVLFKDYKAWAMKQSAAICERADDYAREQSGRPATYIASCHTRKDELAMTRRRELGIERGLIGVWSCLEACSTYRSRFNPRQSFPDLRSEWSRCKHLYFYYDHPDYGFMSARLQTWFPFGVQIAMNGREWLRRSLEKEGVGFVRQDNKFFHVDDYAAAQRLLDRQLDTRWDSVLSGFLPSVFPMMSDTLGGDLTYYWTLWQSEWATDFIFDSPVTAHGVMDRLLRHALMTGTADRVLRYFGRPADLRGQPHPKSNPELFTRVGQWQDGARIRHWVDQNSVKLYNEQNVLRSEVTINNPGRFQVYRHPENDDHRNPKRRLPLRKGIADIPLRAQVSDDVNRSFLSQMATVTDETPMRETLVEVTRPFRSAGRRVRALDVTGKDRELLEAIADPLFNVSGITNKALREKLIGSAWSKGGDAKSLSSRITRHLRLLRDHGLIRKMPNQRKYRLTDKGRALTTALSAILASSTQQLMELAS